VLDIDTDGRAEALQRALAWSEGFSLIFVHAAPGPTRRKLLKRLKKWSGKDEVPPLVFVQLGAAERPFDRLQKLGLEGKERTGVVLSGLEQHAVGGGVSRALAELNPARNLLPKWVPGPLVVVGADEVFLALMASAPDFVTWRGFEISAKAVGEQGEELAAAPRGGIEARGPSKDARVAATRLRGLLAGVLGRRTGYDTLEVARLRMKLGEELTMACEYEEGKHELETALDAFQTAGGGLYEARCVEGLADLALAQSNHATAQASYEQALSLYRSMGSVLGTANCIARLGDIALASSDHETARASYEEALDLYRREGDVLDEANCIQRLGDLARERSDHATARSSYEQALDLYRHVGDVLGEANCIQSLGHIALASSDEPIARASYKQALRLHRRVGDILGVANCTKCLGHLAHPHSDHESARAAYEQALPLYRRAGDAMGEANCIQSLGDLASARADMESARTCYENALHIYQRIPAPHAIGKTHLGLATTTTDPDAFRHHVDAARAAFLSIGRTDLVAELDALFPPA
jgi:tetratricopeptide (TPR) repeat protein